MVMILWLGALVLVMLRWQILEPVLGTKGMFLFDAIFWTCMAAWQLASPGPYKWIGYVCGAASIYWAFSSARTFLRLSEALAKEAKKDGK